MHTLILLDFNSTDDTIAFIDQCRKVLGRQGVSHYVFVENGEDAGVKEKLAASYGVGTRVCLPEIAQPLFFFQTEDMELYYCHSGGNIGYARGNNLGAQIAKAVWNDPYYIFSNNDLVFEKEPDIRIIDRLFSENTQIGVIGPRVVGTDGRPQSPHNWSPAYKRLILFYWRLLIAPLRDAIRARRKSSSNISTPKRTPTGPCDWIMGCFMFVRASAFFEAGMFDPHTFLFAEEMILSRRLEAVGSSVWYCDEMEVLHFHAQSTLKSVSVFRRREMDFESVWYYYKAYTHTSAFLLTLAKWNFALHKILFFALEALRKTFAGTHEEK